MYAHDLKIFRQIENLDDSCALQKDLDAVSELCAQNLMYLNINKFYAISFHSNGTKN